MKYLTYLILVVGICLFACEKHQGDKIQKSDLPPGKTIIPYLKFTCKSASNSKDTSYSVEANNAGYPSRFFIGGSNACSPVLLYINVKYITHKTGFILYDTDHTDLNGTWIPDKELMVGMPFPCGTDATQEAFYSILDTGYYDYAVWDSSFAHRRRYALEDDFYYFFVDFTEYTYSPDVSYIEQPYSSKWGEQDETCCIQIVEVMKQPPVCDRDIPAHILFKARFSCKLYDKAGNFFKRIDDAEMLGVFMRTNLEPDFPIWEDWCVNCANYDPYYLNF